MGDAERANAVPSEPGTASNAGDGQPQLFSGGPPEPTNKGRLIGAAIAVAAFFIIAGGFLLRGGRTAAPLKQNAVLAADAYAGNLAFSQLAMSESTSLSGQTSTFIDGRVKNTGAETLTGVTMQVLFRNDVGLSPQVETLPLTLIRTREPYVDTEPVSAAPLSPGREAEFRLIFEAVNGNWNQQMPDLVVVHTLKR